jgi:hydrogenase maturation protease
VPGGELARDYEPAYSLHDFRWDHALYAGRRIFADRFPTDVTVFLIEAGTLELGCELSTPVGAAAARVTREIEAMIDAYAYPARSRQYLSR